MDKSGADAFVYAKASGMLAKSFVGPRTQLIFEAKKLSELWSLLFSEEVPLIPEVLLAKEIEKKAENQFVKNFSMLLNCYTNPDKVSLFLLKSFDYANLREIVYALSNEEKELPELTDIGNYSELNIKYWPKLSKITEKTSFSWYKEVPSLDDQKDYDQKLDLQYIKNLWAAVQTLPKSEISIVKNFIQEKISLDNCIWALRLKKYYEMSNDEIIEKLFSVEENPSEKDILCGEAIKMLNYDLDSFESFKNWKYKNLLNENTEGEVWFVDPIWIQQSAKIYLTKKAYKSFHQHPFTANVLVSWFFIKQTELDYIRNAVENLRINAS